VHEARRRATIGCVQQVQAVKRVSTYLLDVVCQIQLAVANCYTYDVTRHAGTDAGMLML
jgi:hypothetical protein